MPLTGPLNVTWIAVTSFFRMRESETFWTATSGGVPETAIVTVAGLLVAGAAAVLGPPRLQHTEACQYL